MASPTHPKKLFGGAIEASLPEDFVDVSNIRQVPDNQEVFVHARSNASIIVEVLQRVPVTEDLEAVKYHFQALAHDNDAVSSTMQPPVSVRGSRANQPSPVVLRGSQRIRKFNASAADDVDISVALFRVDSRGGIDEERAAAQFDALVSSLHIVDYGLFADSVS